MFAIHSFPAPLTGCVPTICGEEEVRRARFYCLSSFIYSAGSWVLHQLCTQRVMLLTIHISGEKYSGYWHQWFLLPCTHSSFWLSLRNHASPHSAHLFPVKHIWSESQSPYFCDCSGVSTLTKHGHIDRTPELACGCQEVVHFSAGLGIGQMCTWTSEELLAQTTQRKSQKRAGDWVWWQIWAL